MVNKKCSIFLKNGPIFDFSIDYKTTEQYLYAGINTCTISYHVTIHVTMCQNVPVDSLYKNYDILHVAMCVLFIKKPKK